MFYKPLLHPEMSGVPVQRRIAVKKNTHSPPIFAAQAVMNDDTAIKSVALA